MPELLGDAFNHVFNLDSKLLRTVIGLTREPGTVVSRFADGHRVAYIPPLRYCLVVVAAMLLIYAAFGIDFVDIEVQSQGESNAQQAVAEQARVEIGNVVNARMNLVIFLALPLFSAFLFVLFRGSRRTYAECLAFGFYLMGHVFLLGIPFGLLREVAPVVSIVPRLVLQVVYLTWAAMVFFRQPAWKAALKVVVGTVLYFFAVMLTLILFTLPRLREILAAAREAA